ncbi:MAG TPA: hypothetical protein VGC41_27545 [Kofleriaceae bacterium]
MRSAVRLVAWLVGIVLIPSILGSIAGSIGLVLGSLGMIGAVLWIWLWLPRSAHGAFERGRWNVAARRYRVLGVVTRSDDRSRAAQLSRIGCAIAAARLDAADRMLATIDAATLDVQERAVWLNNRACIVIARGGDAHSALALADEATMLRPDVPALQHTRGMALLAVGRIDDAIAVLDKMRAAGELSPRLEADRCKDLATAWAKKGETAYADDYRLRAEALSPRPGA